MRRTLLVCALLCGCATTPPPAAHQVATTDGDSAADAERDAPPPSSPSPPPSSSQGAPGTIARADLARVLDASPGYFLQRVQTEPRFANGRFHGWRVVSFFPGDARFAGVDLQAGDVVTRINGKPIEKPDQFMAVWSELRTSKELVVDVERGGAARTLRWTIADK